MIYTVTFNPSLDYVMYIDELKTGEINRSGKEEIYPGGKGINVSIVLKNLGFDSIILGFTAGFSGMEIERLVCEFGCKSRFIKVKDGISRINVKIRYSEETDINGTGPVITELDIEKLFNIFDELCDGDIIVLAGSVPNVLTPSIYEDILEYVKNKNVNVIVDAERDLLVNSLKYKPFLVKPNIIELGDIFGRKLKSKDEIIRCARKVRDMGAKNVLVSLAEDGAILIDEINNVYYMKAPKGILVNSVGAGDSMVAGFIAGYLESRDFYAALKKGVASGSASAFERWLAGKEEIDEIMKIL